MPHVVIYDTNEAGLGAIAAAKRLGHRVTFVDHVGARFYAESERNRCAVEAADRVVRREWLTRPDVALEVLRAIHRDEPVDAALTTNELAADPLARACAMVGIPFTDGEAVATARRKHLMRARLAQRGVRSARFEAVDPDDDPTAAAGRLGYPVIVKPTSGSLSLLAGVAENRDDLLRLAGRMRDELSDLPESWREQYGRGILLEERLVGELVSVEIGMCRGEAVRFMVSGRIRAGHDETFELGSVVPADLPEDRVRDCFAYAEMVLEALGLDLGIFHLEVILTAAGPVLVEANPRIMGGPLPLLYNALCGRDIFEDLVSIHLGLRPTVPDRPRDRAVGGMLFVPAVDGVVRGGLDAASVRSRLAPGLEILRLELPEAGRPVEAHRPIGRIWLAGSTSAAVTAGTRRVVEHVASEGGLRLYE